MVDAAVISVAEKLGSFLVQQASLLGGVHGEFEEIRRELESMRSFLKDADRRKESNEGLKSWVGQVRDVAYEVEDIIDEFMFRMDKRSGFRGLLHNSLRHPKSIIVVNQMASQLQKVKTKVVAVSDRRNRYVLDRIEEGAKADETWQRYGESSLFMEEDDIVGIKKSQELLVGWLTDDEPRRRVISVVGMGGLGKTTLAAKAYNCQVIKRHFDCYAWVTVSQSYRIEELLRSLVTEFFEGRKEMVPNNLSTMNYRQLIQTLNNYLQQKRYMLVLDDVWSIDAWREIIVAFPESRCGSRVILTTRNDDVAYFFGPENCVHRLEPLDEEAAWALFCKKAFCNDYEGCPLELEPSARTIMQKCEGLPLAIVAIGGLMGRKHKKKLEWKKVEDSLRGELSSNPMLERVKNILLLSYHDLPYYLKHCFLYCSVFPEDYLIKRKMIIRLWVAEGFVEERRGLTMEDVAEHYLQELVHRSMIQVAWTNDFGRVKACRMHDLVRDLALSVSEKENFCAVQDGTEIRQDGKARHLSIHKSSKYIPTDMSMSSLRSFFVFITDAIPSSSLNRISSSFRLLKVLDLQGASIEILPDELFDLFNLRYLNLRKNKIRELPKTLGRLQNLQILDVRENKMERLTSRIGKLQKLRHLFVHHRDPQSFGSFDYVGGMQVPTGVWKLINLQSLNCIEASQVVVRQVGNLTQLRKLGIGKLRSEDGPELCTSIEKMNCLLNLYLTATNEEEMLQLQALSHPPPLLHKLILVGRLEKLPNWIGSLCNLTHLSLHWSRLEVDPFYALHALPNLVRLSLSKAYDGRCIWLHSGWFVKLKILELSDLTQLHIIRIERRAIPSVQSLFLICCKELKELPQGIEHLTGLQQLHLQEMPKELVESLRRQESKDRQRAQHIPDIKHVFQVDQTWFSESLT